MLRDKYRESDLDGVILYLTFITHLAGHIEFSDHILSLINLQ